MPTAAADSGWKRFEASIQAHTFASFVIWARKESARAVRPEHSGPIISVIAPTGTPPFTKSSIVRMPVETTGRMILGAGVKADGIRSANADSIWIRSAEVVGI